MMMIILLVMSNIRVEKEKERYRNRNYRHLISALPHDLEKHEQQNKMSENEPLLQRWKKP